MAETTRYRPGDRVVFTTDGAGVLARPTDHYFVSDYSVPNGAHGTVAGPHPDEQLAKNDWHYVLVVDDKGVIRWCPLHESMFEKAPDL